MLVNNLLRGAWPGCKNAVLRAFLTNLLQM